MPGLLPHVDPDGLLEFSVVYTDRSLNHLSKRFASLCAGGGGSKSDRRAARRLVNG